jgi:hypothetical protein
MTGTIRFLLDENLDVVYHTELMRREPDLVVWRIGSFGAPPKGTGDSDILSWCERNGFVLVTNNRRSMPVHLQRHLEQGSHEPGILILNADMSIGDTIQELITIWGASEEEEYRDNIWYLPVSSRL